MVSALPQPEHPDLSLVRRGDRLEIHDATADAPVFVDFVAGSVARRVLGIGRRKHPLARAVGRTTPLPHVLDATAGLGRDAFVLACLGYHVLAVERNAAIHALLADGVARLLASDRADLVVDRLVVEHGECRDYLARAPEVVYLDPMFPESGKAALAKKEMQLFQKLLGSERDSADLLAAARAAATVRVVVKRPRRAEPLARDPSYSVAGTKVRWDVYLTAR